MATKVCLLLCIAMLLSLVVQGQHKSSPAPIAQPGNPLAPTPQPIKFPMYGATPGSLQPQGKVLGGLLRAVLGDGVQEAVPVLLPKVLRQVPVRAAGNLRQQAVLSLLQQLEDQERRPQMPLKLNNLNMYAHSPPNINVAHPAFEFSIIMFPFFVFYLENCYPCKMRNYHRAIGDLGDVAQATYFMVTIDQLAYGPIPHN
ncbi:hypothetical protein ZIOFF_045968 [Zingiber officinale]|uniref:Uncharacterized protein n=1 Tax=Zingiber officinale TaxID=94328 RepID=A0A8J5G061_ZINOF|nr:hypothetical protein ZIOFF_045968 [Zingiber officinale]